MKKTLFVTTVFFLMVFAVFHSRVEANTLESSQRYVCGGLSQVSVYDMRQPIVAYLDAINRWVTFERGEVMLNYQVRHYFTWDGVEWTFNFLPAVGDIKEIQYDYELWARTSVPELGVNLLEAFNRGYLAPNCWSEESLAQFEAEGVLAPANSHKLPPPGFVGDF